MTLLRRVAGRSIVALASLPGSRYCCICESRIARFLPYTPKGVLPYRQPAFMAAMDVVGSDIDNFSCPRCGAHDRERHLVLYLRVTGLLSKLAGARILHIAPEQHLSRILHSQQPARYVMGDLFPTQAGIERVDLLAIDYPAGSFDVVIANHVMEHVADDLAALAEIHRVLAEGGYAILQTPYSSILAAKFEDPGIATAEARLQAYGQEDHVRLYGRDICERFASAGFADRTVTHAAALPGINARRYGVNPFEPLLLFEKVPGATATAATRPK